MEGGGNGTETNVLDSMRLSFVHRVREPSFISALVSYLSVFFLFVCLVELTVTTSDSIL